MLVIVLFMCFAALLGFIAGVILSPILTSIDDEAIIEDDN